MEQNQGMNPETESPWRTATSALAVLMLALLFAVVATAWVVVPHDAPIEPLLIPLMVVLFVALLVAAAVILHRHGKNRSTLGRHS